jgi:hypothetical protein
MRKGADWARRPANIARFESNLAARLEYGRRKRATEEAEQSLLADERRTGAEFMRNYEPYMGRERANLAARGAFFHGTAGGQRMQEVGEQYRQRHREALQPFQEKRRELRGQLVNEGANLGARANQYFRELLRGQQDYGLRRAELGLRGSELKARLALAEQEMDEAPEYRRPTFPRSIQEDYYGFPYYGVFDRNRQNYMGDAGRGWGAETRVPLRKTHRARMQEGALGVEQAREARMAQAQRFQQAFDARGYDPINKPGQFRTYLEGTADRDARRKAQADAAVVHERNVTLFEDALREAEPEFMAATDDEAAGAVSAEEMDAIIAAAVQYGLSTEEAAEIVQRLFNEKWAESVRRFGAGVFGSGQARQIKPRSGYQMPHQPA